MEIALALACSHAGLIISRKDRAPAAQSDHFYATFEALRREISALRPDAIVIVATDHMKAWTLAGGVPQYAVGVGPTAHGLGDGGVAPRDIAVHQEFAVTLLEGCVSQGADVAFAEDVRIDHSFVVPLTLLDPDGTIPIVPVTQNCNVPPRPTFERSLAFGEQARKALDGVDGRIVFVATGGLSHWVGDDARREFMRRRPGTRLPDLAAHPVELEETGPINEKFDSAFLGAMQDARLPQFLREWTDERLEREAGNGAHELRNWASAYGFVGGSPAAVLCYEPVDEWLTGVGVVRFRV
jgi:aromatic ring-opening dioxygenase catalytic subunit (LigB family)